MTVPSPARLSDLYRTHFANARRELLFVSGISFFVTFGVTRGIVQVLLHRAGFRGVKFGGIHVHHHVLGNLMLVGSGHAWLHLASTRRRDDRRLLRAATIVYAAGSALTLDEFALTLHLEDVYWRSPGREIIDTGILLISIGSIAAWGAPFFKALGQEIRGKGGQNDSAERGEHDQSGDTATMAADGLGEPGAASQARR